MAAYDLKAVQAAASCGKVQFLGRQAATDAANLGYGLSDVCNCVSGLCSSEFEKSKTYKDGDPRARGTFDVYRTTFGRRGRKVDLYLKLKLFHDGQGDAVILASIHPAKYK
jgi:hypothetical protein